MVHPEVLKSGGLDPEEWSGYAWGGGIERLYMLRHGIFRHSTFHIERHAISLAILGLVSYNCVSYFGRVAEWPNASVL